MPIVTVKARIYFYASEAGGRASYAASGYRSLIRLCGLNTSGRMRFIGSDRVEPGEAVEAYIDLPNPGYVASCIREGIEFAISEGIQDVGEGTILSVTEGL